MDSINNIIWYDKDYKLIKENSLLIHDNDRDVELVVAYGNKLYISCAKDTLFPLSEFPHDYSLTDFNLKINEFRLTEFKILAENIKVGNKLKILELKDEPRNTEYVGKVGVITLIDDAMQIHGTWGGLAVIPSIDSFEIIMEDKLDENK